MMSSPVTSKNDPLQGLDFQFNRQLIIDFLKDDSMTPCLKRRWNKYHVPEASIVVDGHDFLNGKCTPSMGEDSKIRIYLLAHGGDYLADKFFKKIDISALAKALVQLIGDKKLMV